MTTKLTLTIEQGIIKIAKTYAHKQGRSLSDLVENYLKALVQNNSKMEEISPKVKKLMGVIKLPKDFDYKKVLGEEINKRYSR